MHSLLCPVLVVLLLGGPCPTAAFWTVDCGIVTIERSDPIVSPGTISAHTHVVAGSDTFGPSATNAILRQGSCTSCDVKEDKSAYWTPQLYVAPPAAEGKLQEDIEAQGGVPVPLVNGNAFIIYYKLITEKGERQDNDVDKWGEIVPFPRDFRMLVSESMIKEKTKTAAILFNHPVTYKCLGFGDQRDTEDFPSNPELCTGGLRTQLTFPSCWDGQSTDSADHGSHVSYPIGSWAGSPCPASHPIRVPTLFIEVIYKTTAIEGELAKGWKLMFPGMPNQFLDNGAPLFHADFMNGWQQDFLTEAVKDCGITPCPLIQKRSSSCKKLDQNPSPPAISPPAISPPPSTPSPSPEPIPPEPPSADDGFTLLWADEFDSSSLDTTKWTPMEGDGCEYGICGWGNGEFQYYTNMERNAFVSDGRLVIRSINEERDPAALESFRSYCKGRCLVTDQGCISRCDSIKISSARLRTKGKFEVSPKNAPYKDMDIIKIQTRFRVTPGAGQWTAIWMLPSANEYGGWAASGEIDIMEAANSMDSSTSAIHYGGSWPQNVFYTKRASADVAQWTTITYYWEEDFMRWEVNGNEYMTAQSGQGRTREGWYTTAPNAPPNAPFDENFHLLVNLAVGGGYTGNVPLDAALQALNEGPKQLEVDYIRVYGKSNMNSPSPSPSPIPSPSPSPIPSPSPSPSPSPIPSPSPSPIPAEPVDSCSFCSNIKQQGKPYGYYGDPSSGCRGYYTCRKVGAWYNECPPDLLFNEASAVCDQPGNVVC